MAEPWKEEIDDFGDIWLILDNGHRVFWGDMEHACKTCHEYLTLAVAAPKLLAACQALMDAILHGSDDWSKEGKAHDLGTIAVAEALGKKKVG